MERIKIIAMLAGYLVGSLLFFFCFYLAAMNHVEPTEVGLAWNLTSGELSMQEPGWHVSAPWVEVARVDTRPMRVCITSATRAFNCKLAQFVPSEYKLFVATEGFHYYWWYNRISVNFGYADEYRGMKDILRGYAFGVKQYPFVVTLRDFSE